MTPTPRRISVAVTAATLTGNHGAEAMLLATVGRLRDRFPDAVFQLFSYYPEADRRVAGAPHVRVFSLAPFRLVAWLLPWSAAYALVRTLGLRVLLPWFPGDVRALAESDVQVDLAGVSFVDGRERFLPFNVLSLVPAFLLGVPVVKLSQALGPFEGTANRRAARATLGWCRTVFARGERTLGHLRELAPATDVRAAADVAFLLEAQDRLTAPAHQVVARVARRVEAARASGGGVVGICPSSLLVARYPESYPALIRSLITAVTEAGDWVLLFPNATRASADAGPRNNDLFAIRRIVDALSEEARRRVIAVEEDLHAVDLLQVVEQADATVVSRFHAMVASLSLALPTVVVGWSHKYREVMEAFDLGAYVFDAGSTESGGLTRALNELRGNAPEVQDALAARLDGVRLSALTQVTYVADTVVP